MEVKLITKKPKDSFESLQSRIRDAIRKKFEPNLDNGEPGMEFGLEYTYPDSVIVKSWNDEKYYEIPYTLDLDGVIQLGEPIEKDEVFKDITNEMKQGNPLILLNTDETAPIYRMLIQTSDELPAHDMGLNKIQYTQEAIENGLKGLVGGFVYDETQSQHNRKVNPTMRGRKVAKIVSKGFLPDYGGFVDVEPFDNEFKTTVNQALDNRKRGLPVKEGPSTELKPLDGERYGDNSLKITDLDYTGLAWVNKPRDSKAGVCGVLNVNNSIEKLLEDEIVTDEVIVKISKDEYDQLKADKQKLEELEPEFEKGKGLYVKGKQLYEDLKEEEGKLREQLIPVWNAQGEQKMEMVNSILETIPEADREAKKADLEKLDLTALGVIVNSLPAEGGPRGIQDGAQGGNPADKDVVFEDPEKQKEWDAAQKLPTSQSRRGVGIIASTQKEE